MHSKDTKFLLALWLCFTQFAFAGIVGQLSFDRAIHEKRSLRFASEYLTYACNAPYERIWKNWYSDTSSPTGYFCSSYCCGIKSEFTSCPGASMHPWPGFFVNGICSGYSAYDCCYTEDGFTKWNFPACYESQQKIVANWNADLTSCVSTTLSDCCATRQKYTSCTGSSKPFPGKWNSGVCSGLVPSDCCFVEDNLTSYSFNTCYKNQEMIQGKWSNGICYATLLSQCCWTKDVPTSSDTSGNREEPGATDTNSLVPRILLGLAAACGFLIPVCSFRRSCVKRIEARKNNPPQTSTPATIPATIENQPFSVSMIHHSKSSPETTNTSGGEGGVPNPHTTFNNVNCCR